MIFLGQTRLPDEQRFIPEPGAAATEADAALDELWSASDDYYAKTGNFNSQGRLLAEAYRERNKAILDATGEDPTALSKQERARLLKLAGPDVDIETATRLAYQTRLRDIASRHPDKVDVIRPETPISADTDELARKSERRFNAANMRVAQSEAGTLAKFGHALGGGMQAMVRDPVQVSAMFLGGGPSTARTMGGRILSVALTEAVINAGTEGAVQAYNYDWKKKAGLDVSVRDSLEQVGMAGLFGGGLGGLIEGGRAVYASLGKAVPEEVLAAAAHGDDAAIRTIASDVGADIAPADAAMLARAADEDLVNTPLIGADVPQAQQFVNRAALKHAEDPEAYFAPDIVERMHADERPDYPRSLTTADYEKLYDLEPLEAEATLRGHYGIESTPDPREGEALADGLRFEPEDAEAMRAAELYAGEIADVGLDGDGNVKSAFDYLYVSDGDGNPVRMAARDALAAADDDNMLADLLDACKA